MAALVPKTLDLKHAAIAIAFLLDTNIAGHLSDALAEAVMAKALNWISNIMEKLSSTANFLTANNAKHAELTLALEAMLVIWGGVSSLLGAVATQFTNAPLPSLPSTALIWASIFKASVGLLTTLAPSKYMAINTLSTDKLSQIQQRDSSAPEVLLATRMANLCNKLDKSLKSLNKEAMVLRVAKDGEMKINMPRTHTIGLKLISHSAFLAGFDSADSAFRFHNYAMVKWETFNKIFSNYVEVVDKAFNIIARFVPCTGSVNPDDYVCLCTIKLENGLAADSIFSALWFKHPGL
ncbi:hypothetical protein C0989_011102 [Termitomyces sp. Mn162]|nr:hypothetical protein C0989_011102 [Termitomyces sp. Mn162]